MSKTIHIRPANGHAVVFHPDMKTRLSGRGEEVEDCSYWQRRIKHGEVEEYTPEPETSPKPTSNKMMTPAETKPEPKTPATKHTPERGGRKSKGD